MSNIVGLFGDLPVNGQPVASCVKVLEQWLQMAQSGHIVGVAMGGVTAGNKGCNAVAGFVGSYALLGALAVARVTLERETVDVEQ